MLVLGVYPEISLSEARQRRDAAKRQVANAIDPSEQFFIDHYTHAIDDDMTNIVVC